MSTPVNFWFYNLLETHR